MQTILESAILEVIFKTLDISRDISESAVFRPELQRGARSYQIGKHTFFIKIQSADYSEHFRSEALALELIAQTNTIKVPKCYGVGATDKLSFIVLEAFELIPRSTDDWEAMGRQIAALHRTEGLTYGWERNNTIGMNPQSNRPHDNWCDFFIEERLKPQLKMAESKAIQIFKADKLLQLAKDQLHNHRPPPSLLHGDLWSGNAGFTEAGTPVIYDPATYYGDRETDLAFSEFFGGFPPAFYKAYDATFPISPGYEQRKDLYNLYHSLNHANLYGMSYVLITNRIIEKLISGSQTS